MQLVRRAGPALVPRPHVGAPTDDDVGVVGRHQVGHRVVVTGWHQQDRVATCESGQVGDDGLDLVGRGDEHEAALGPEPLARRGHTLAQVAVGERRAGGVDQRHPFAVAGQRSGEGNRRRARRSVIRVEGRQAGRGDGECGARGHVLGGSTASRTP